MEAEADQTGAIVLSAIALVPYFGWGIYSLRLHFRYHEEFRPAVGVATLAGIAVFYLIEIALLRSYLDDQPAFFLFALLGLFVSGAALYGNMIVSLLSQVLVDAVAPGERSHTKEPRYGPAEALERMGDYEGALEEFMVVARIFPRESKPVVKIADLYVKLQQPAQAVRWFERALRMVGNAEEALQTTNRACELHLRQLDQPIEAIRLLEDYLDRFPESEFADKIEGRIRHIEEQMEAPKAPTPEPVVRETLPPEEDGQGLPMLPSEQDAESAENDLAAEGDGLPVLPSHPDSGNPPDDNDAPADTNQMPTL